MGSSEYPHNRAKELHPFGAEESDGPRKPATAGIQNEKAKGVALKQPLGLFVVMKGDLGSRHSDCEVINNGCKISGIGRFASTI